MNAAELEELIGSLPQYSRPSEVVGGFIADFQKELMAGEETFIASAVEKRRREFIAGRTAARMALQKAGGNLMPILSGEHREPIWPTGFTGSITHSDTICFAACVRSELGLFVGLDVEIYSRLKRDLWRMVFDPAETAEFLASAEPDLIGAAAFSAKESFEKAQFAASGKVMEFKDMRATVNGDGSFGMSHKTEDSAFAPVPEFVRGRWMKAGDHVFTFVMFARA